MPHAIEWSLATPMISPRLPCISCVMAPKLYRFAARPSARAELHIMRPSNIEALEHHRGIRAAEAERIRQHAAELHVVATFAHDRHVGESRIKLLDVGAFADEAIVHHQQRIDRFLRAGRAERMASK